MYPDDSEPVRGCDADRGDPGPASRAADSMMAAYAAGGGRPTWDAEEDHLLSYFLDGGGGGDPHGGIHVGEGGGNPLSIDPTPFPTDAAMAAAPGGSGVSRAGGITTTNAAVASSSTQSLLSDRSSGSSSKTIRFSLSAGDVTTSVGRHAPPTKSSGLTSLGGVGIGGDGGSCLKVTERPSPPTPAVQFYYTPRSSHNAQPQKIQVQQQHLFSGMSPVSRVPSAASSSSSSLSSMAQAQAQAHAQMKAQAQQAMQIHHVHLQMQAQAQAQIQQHQQRQQQGQDCEEGQGNGFLHHPSMPLVAVVNNQSPITPVQALSGTPENMMLPPPPRFPGQGQLQQQQQQNLQGMPHPPLGGFNEGQQGQGQCQVPLQHPNPFMQQAQNGQGQGHPNPFIQQSQQLEEQKQGLGQVMQYSNPFVQQARQRQGQPPQLQHNPSWIQQQQINSVIHIPPMQKQGQCQPGVGGNDSGVESPVISPHQLHAAAPFPNPFLHNNNARANAAVVSQSHPPVHGQQHTAQNQQDQQQKKTDTGLPAATSPNPAPSPRAAAFGAAQAPVPLDPAAAAALAHRIHRAAARTAGSGGGKGGAPGKSSGSASSDLASSAAENAERRARRLARNRESARQSRRRKKELLNTLGGRVNDLHCDIEELRADRIRTMERDMVEARSVAVGDLLYSTTKNDTVKDNDGRRNEEEMPLRLRLDGVVKNGSPDCPVRSAVASFRHDTLRKLLLPGHRRYLLWMSTLPARYFLAGKETKGKATKTTSARLSSKQIGEEISHDHRLEYRSGKGDRPNAECGSDENQADMFWPLFAYETSLSVDQEERWAQMNRRQLYSPSLPNDRAQVGVANDAISSLEMSVRYQGHAAGHRNRTALLDVLTPEQAVKFLGWMRDNGDRCRDVLLPSSAQTQSQTRTPSPQEGIHRVESLSDVCRCLNKSLNLRKRDPSSSVSSPPCSPSLLQ